MARNLKKISLILTCLATISIGCANANYSRCQEYYTPTGLIRDCQNVYVSQVVYPMMPPPVPPAPMIYNTRPYYGIYPHIGLNLNFGSRHHHSPMRMHHGMLRGHHGRFGAGVHISI